MTGEVITVENNLSGQFANILRREIGVDSERINHYDGTPLSPAGLHETLKEKLLP